MKLIDLINEINVSGLTNENWSVSVNGCSTAFYTGIENVDDEILPPHIAIWSSAYGDAKLAFLCCHFSDKIIQIDETVNVSLFFVQD